MVVLIFFGGWIFSNKILVLVKVFVFWFGTEVEEMSDLKSYKGVENVRIYG